MGNEPMVHRIKIVLRNIFLLPVYSSKIPFIFQEEFLLEKALEELKNQYGCERITIQSGGTINGMFLREKLFDYVDIVVAPVLIGGKNTSTLIDGSSITNEDELGSLGVLQLENCKTLDNSYIRLRYKVIS